MDGTGMMMVFCVSIDFKCIHFMNFLKLLFLFCVREQKVQVMGMDDIHLYESDMKSD